ncbi:hypothetical protein OS493_032819 [Desmophyllum pertusum]|uniref:Uncharacterized protein n=1 Tax=Desmophyllum pertusum TaxID=174260 RepID=A0A9W9Z8E1_9CNID|nr:hypothetical protein OS493_032819 [Desmophyllum pertusum]
MGTTFMKSRTVAQMMKKTMGTRFMKSRTMAPMTKKTMGTTFMKSRTVAQIMRIMTTVRITFMKSRTMVMIPMMTIFYRKSTMVTVAIYLEQAPLTEDMSEDL